MKLFSATLLFLVTSTHVLAQSPEVKTNSGILRGLTTETISVFKGIPYAAPPVNDLRWRAPQSPVPWQGIRSAENFANACIQLPGLSEANGGNPGALSEDCLYLNVWTPSPNSAAHLPVIVWIHGGAFVFGSGAVPIYSGASLAKRGAVFVSINYRLGPLGFFAHPALAAESPNGPVNFALLDQIAALEWVQSNIANFGGDPHNVTIIGQSAGARSVLALFASPRARGLFQKGIAMSNYGLLDVPRAKAATIAADFATHLGLNGASATLAELRAVPAEKFVAPAKDPSLSIGPVFIAGDSALPKSVHDAFSAGNEAALPLILGNTSNDSSVVTEFGVAPAEVIKKLGAAGIFVKPLYPGVKDQNELGRLVARDVLFTMPARLNADRHSRRAPSWRYYFDYTAENDRAANPDGVSHGAEIAYFLDTLSASKIHTTPADQHEADLASDYVFNFAKTGKPASSSGPAWPQHTAAQDRTLQFANSSTTVQSNFLRPRLNAQIAAAKLLYFFSRK